MAKAATAMEPAMCILFCRVCGVPHQAIKGLETDKAIMMAWWELDNLIRGIGCPVCHGMTPKYIMDMGDADLVHVSEGLTIQWMSSIRKACPKTQPYEAFPEPEVPP